MFLARQILVPCPPPDKAADTRHTTLHCIWHVGVSLQFLQDDGDEGVGSVVVAPGSRGPRVSDLCVHESADERAGAPLTQTPSECESLNSLRMHRCRRGGHPEPECCGQLRSNVSSRLVQSPRMELFGHCRHVVGVVSANRSPGLWGGGACHRNRRHIWPNPVSCPQMPKGFSTLAVS